MNAATFSRPTPTAPNARLAALALAALLAVGLLLSFWVSRPAWLDLLTLSALVASTMLLPARAFGVPKRMVWPAIALVCTAVMSVQASPDFDRSTRALVWLVGYFMAFVNISAAIRLGLTPAILWRVWQWVALIVALIALVPWALAGFPLHGWRLYYETNNAMALYNLLVLGSIAAGQLSPALFPAPLIAWLSASRGGWAGLVAGAALLVRDWRGMARRWWPVLLAGAGALVLVAWQMDLPHRAGRWYLWSVALEMWRLHPIFGAGLDAFQHYWQSAPRIDSNAYGHAHGIIFDVLSQMGAVGVAVWLWLMWAIGRELWPRRGQPWGRAAIVGSVALGVQSLADSPTTQTYVMMTWLVLLALALVEEPDE